MEAETARETMTAVVLDEYSGPGGLRVEQRPVPVPGKNEVLVRVAASPVNPSDLAFLQGQYGIRKQLPVIPGFEGSGNVVETGPGFLAGRLKGKRVACLAAATGDGLWAEYAVLPVSSALPLHDRVSLEHGANSINPLTAMAFMEIIRQHRAGSIVLTAAASALCLMVNRLCRHGAVQVINIVRREAQVEQLKNAGATTVLNSSAGDFKRQLHDACREHGARLAFDAVAGDMTEQLLEAMPRHGTIIIYGALSMSATAINPGLMIFRDVRVQGFWLAPWIAGKNLLQLLLTWRRMQKMLMTDLQTGIRDRYSLNEIGTAIAAYQNRMSGGKVLLTPAS